ncbi:MAG: hypothetical protein JSV84_13555 [Gemmatimonadota bacterium]|nr:MAG: hypothetical protein JSV84_13555 [Gemmatimonadota bacterium]
MEFFWTTVAVLLTLCVFSFLYKDNPLYKFVEHLFVGIAAGYVIAVQFHNVFVPNIWHPLTKGLDWWPVVPLIMGLFLFARFFPRGGWISLWPMALILGTYSGLAVIGFASGDLVIHIQSNLIPIIDVGSVKAFAKEPGLFTFLQTLTNPLIVLGLICTLSYFFCSKEYERLTRITSKIGVAFLMIGFGAGYGYTVMTRIALLIDRFFLIFSEWLGIIQ